MKIIVRPTPRGKFVWNFVARNGRITANNETFPTRGNAVRAAKGNVLNVARMLYALPVQVLFKTTRVGAETHITIFDGTK